MRLSSDRYHGSTTDSHSKDFTDNWRRRYMFLEQHFIKRCGELPRHYESLTVVPKGGGPQVGSDDQECLRLRNWGVYGRGDEVMESTNAILSRIFSKKTVLDLINEKSNPAYSAAVWKYLQGAESQDNRAVMQNIYQVIDASYRNEYFYKNTLLNKLLLGRHSLKTTTALSEVAINKSKADFVLINGRASVYEIKTELDTLNRLRAQVLDYYKAFKSVCVVTSESNYERTLKKLAGDPHVGIYVLTRDQTISHKREPIDDGSKLQHRVLFRILRKNEFENILLKQYGHVPTAQPVQYYRECFQWFRDIEIEVAYRHFLFELKKRSNVESVAYGQVPYELKSLVYFSNFLSDDYRKLNKFLNTTFGG